MISGARELMTPGAWEKQGLTYRLSGTPAASSVDAVERQRRAKLEHLRDELWSYAQAHDGYFPTSDHVPETPSELWLASDSPRLRYLYVAGQRADRGAIPLVYEPGSYGDRRLVLLTNGTLHKNADLHKNASGCTKTSEWQEGVWRDVPIV
jgi:hypothetical protein